MMPYMVTLCCFHFFSHWNIRFNSNLIKCSCFDLLPLQNKRWCKLNLFYKHLDQIDDTQIEEDEPWVWDTLVSDVALCDMTYYYLYL